MSILKKNMKHVFSHLPCSVRKGLGKFYVAHKRRQIERSSTPVGLTFFVTNRCNARCAHCFYWQELNQPGDELSLSEIERIAASLDRPVHLSLTGGEPTLRLDLLDICRVFRRVNKCRNMAFATNGFLPDRTVAVCSKILDELRPESLAVQVSLDGLEETHTRIRGVKNGFKSSMATLDRLSNLAREDATFSVAVSITLQKCNINEVDRMIESLLPFRVPIRFAILRGQSFGTYALPKSIANDIDPKDQQCPVVNLDTLESAFARIGALNDAAPYKFWSDLQQRKIEVSLRIMREKRKQCHCYAGAVDGVLYPNGDVALCELTKPVGNVREFAGNFKAVWNSSRAAEAREKIKHCFCVHGCSLITSIMLNPDTIALE